MRSQNARFIQQRMQYQHSVGPPFAGVEHQVHTADGGVRPLVGGAAAQPHQAVFIAGRNLEALGWPAVCGYLLLLHKTVLISGSSSPFRPHRTSHHLAQRYRPRPHGIRYDIDALKARVGRRRRYTGF